MKRNLDDLRFELGFQARQLRKAIELMDGQNKPALKIIEDVAGILEV
jgi:hypothetical protein